MKISEIISAIEELAPIHLKEEYDNPGLQVGDSSVEATGALLCVDVTEEVVEEAIECGINLIISHHPILFKGLKSVTGKNYIERVVIKAIKHDIVIYSAHTNLDNAYGGVNYRIAQNLNLSNVRVLSPLNNQLLKLVVFVPVAAADNVRLAMLNSGAGKIGDYDMCSYNMSGYGTFRACEGANPYCGEIGSIHTENEVRIEVVLPIYLKNKVVDAMLKVHPYQEPAYDIIKLENANIYAGSGVIGELSDDVTTEDFLKRIKKVFNVESIKYSSVLKEKIKKVALCGGSGAFLINNAIRENADVFITGEIGYHNFFTAENKILLVEAGHYETEQCIKDIFCDIITKKFPNFAVRYTNVRINPINYL